MSPDRKLYCNIHMIIFCQKLLQNRSPNLYTLLLTEGALLRGPGGGADVID